MESEANIRGAMLKTAVATILWGALHSLLASRPAKERATQLIGQRNRNGLFRLFYNAQAVLTFGALLLYIWRLPNQTLYRAKGPLRWLQHLGQLICAAFALWGMWHLGILRMAGIASFVSWWRSRLTNQNVEAEPDGQGPRLDDNGKMHMRGPYRWSRHPLNFAPLPVLWLMPKMTTNLLSFNIIMTLYSWLASFHEENRLCKTYGEAYEEYAESEIPFFIPCPHLSCSAEEIEYSREHY